MPFRLGPFELIVILLIIFIVFGAGKLPEVGGAIGKGIRAFRKAQKGEDETEAPPSKETTKKIGG